MGGFFGGSSNPPAPPPPMPVAVDPEVEARKLRLETIDRNRRGRAGMIATSERGVLDLATAQAGNGKRLLGE